MLVADAILPSSRLRHVSKGRSLTLQEPPNSVLQQHFGATKYLKCASMKLPTVVARAVLPGQPGLLQPNCHHLAYSDGAWHTMNISGRHQLSQCAGIVAFVIRCSGYNTNTCMHAL